MSDNTTYIIHGMLIIVMFILTITIGASVIPMESTEENRPLLSGILSMNFLFAIAVYLFVYHYNSIVQENIFHVSMIFTFLIALPITLYNMGVTSILFSN